MNFEIIPFEIKYAAEFGTVIYNSWEETYRGLMPDSILDNRSLERWEKRARENPENKYIALCNGKIVGIIGLLPKARDFVSDKNSGEIVALYVLKDYQKQGVGKALLNEAIKSMEPKNITLFVLKGNENAIEFYKHMKFEFTGKEIFDNGLIELEMLLRR